MPQPTLISVPSPCPELWEQMTPVTSGRHCASCQKTVQDFSAFSDRELANWLATYTGDAACGRFRADQLERPIHQVRSGRPTPVSWVRWAVALVLGWQTAKGQHRQPMADFSILLVPAIETALSNSSTIATETDTNQLVTYTVSGKVIDENQLPLQAVSVLLKGTNRGVVTDQKGVFRLPLPVSDSLRPRQLVFHYVGFISQVISITSDNPDPLVVTLYASNLVLGEVCVVSPRRGSFLRRAWWSTRRLFVRQR